MTILLNAGEKIKKLIKTGLLFIDAAIYIIIKNCKKRCKEIIVNFDYKSNILDDNFDENILCKKHIYETKQIVKLNS